MLWLRHDFDSRLGRCCSVGQRTCLRRTLTAAWRVVLAGLRPGDRPGTRDRDQAIAMALGDLARQVRTATDGHAEEPHERA
jgi:hypothetical protein